VIAVNERPVRLVVTDDLQRNRLTVFLRLLLALPHLLWLALWGVVVFLVVLVNWVATLIAGQSPQALHGFLARYVRYAIHVGAYLFLAADPFPGFLGEKGYPIDVEIAPPAPQNRWTVLFRVVLAIPAAIVAGALASSGARNYGVHYGFGLLGVAAFLGWWVALVQARMPRGLRDAMAYAISYTAQLDAYLFLLTDRYPSSDPLTIVGPLPARGDAVQVEVTDDLQRNRWTVFFRLLLAIPHLLWLVAWGIAAWLAAIVNWLATLVSGRSPEALHRFLGAYVRYQTQVYAYLLLIANPFPSFSGAPGRYPIDVTIAERREQNRWKVFFRAFLALPALLLGSAYGGALYAAGFLGWFAALFTGRMPVGLRNMGALALRYLAQENAYLMLLTEQYPYSGPTIPSPSMPETVPSPVA
jgi:Domain of unknown function (DUF4389)